MAKEEAAVKAESTINQVVDTVQQGKVQEALEDFWITHQDALLHFCKVLLLALIIILVTLMIGRLIRKVIDRAVAKVPSLDQSVGNIFYSIARTFLWLFTCLIILDLFGFNTASLLTVLGAAGLAVGLAMKDSLSNIAAGLMLLLLRPYKVGDYIDCGSVSGTIKEMGLFTTTLSTPDGIFIAAPNSTIFGSPVKNYSRNSTRRVDITVGISYGDSLPEGIRTLQALMEKNELILKDPAPQVLVADLADSSVNLTLRFWTASGNYWTAYWQIKEELKGALESAGLNIPFPQRVITFANAIPGENKKAQ
ncbi:MAG: mechanosensitive ion channel family protein [Lentisphaeria bacterium]|nr:mechanosensitive ion channel family protein [Lentisphaeria bacterium]